MLNFLRPQKERSKIYNEKQVAKLEKQIYARKLSFRENAVAKFTFLYPDIIFLISATSENFLGYSKKENKFISGRFFDNYLPKLADIQEHVESENFQKYEIQFAKDIQYLTYTSNLADPEEKKYDEEWMELALAQNRDNGYQYNENYYLYDIRLLKNGRLIARSDVANPKPNGYFANKAYGKIIQDTKGSGYSSIVVRLFLWNYEQDLKDDIVFVYRDPPRDSEAQFRDNYLQFCSLFMPFIQEIEQYMSDPKKREDYVSTGETDGDLGLY